MCFWWAGTLNALMILIIIVIIMMCGDGDDWDGHAETGTGPRKLLPCTGLPYCWPPFLS